MSTSLMSFSPDEIVSMTLGLASTALVFYVNRHLYGVKSGVATSGLEVFYYIVAIAALGIGWSTTFVPAA